MNLIIVDCQNDFVNGALAAPNGEEIVEKLVEYLDSSDEDINVYYTSDFHPSNHMSFKDEGGIWPAHCVEDTFGAEIHEDLRKSKYPANHSNTFYKGRDAEIEEYSAFEAKNSYGESLKDLLGDSVSIVGIASEYCVRETAIAFKEVGKEVTILEDLLGYINKEDHLKNLEDLESRGIEVK